MTVNGLKKRCEELIAQGYGDAELIYIKDFFYDHPQLDLFTPDKYHPDDFWGNDFPSDSKDFVLIDEADDNQ